MAENWQCVFGKHHFKIVGNDTGYCFLDAEIFFECIKCHVPFRIDRLILKMYVMGRPQEGKLIAHGR